MPNSEHANDAISSRARRTTESRKLQGLVLSSGLTLPIDATLADLRAVMGEPGRYRLLWLDQADHPIEDTPEAHDHDDV